MDKDYLYEWLRSGGYMPSEFRDFHDQKNLFKAMHNTIHNADANGNARDGHIYVVDTFLWYMARCGYTLQRSRKKLPFKDFTDDINNYKDNVKNKFSQMIGEENETD